MTGNEIESIKLKRLIAEIQADLDALEEIFCNAADIYEQISDEPTEHQKMAIAGYLHHFYTGVEAIHQRIAQAIEGDVPSGEQWHRELLTDMALELLDVRPRVISAETKNSLHEYLSFRHVFRHAYSLKLDWSRLKLLIEELGPVFNRYKSDLEKFLSHLLSYMKTLEENK